MSKEFSGEKLLFKVIDDLADFLPYLVLVGGWVPYIYARYIWKNVPNMAVTTGDIDFGVGAQDYNGKDTVASCVQRLGYGERHVSMDRSFPFVPIVKDASGDVKAEVEFITDPKVSRKLVNKIVGQEIKINEIQHFSLLLGSVLTAQMDLKSIQIPTESMFTFHKALTFVDRENEEKLRKDLYYVYYMLRFCPKREQLADDVVALIKKRKEGKQVKENLKEYFSSVDSKGPLFVGQENGPDAYIDNVRQDAFDKFSGIRQRVEE
ncbi:MAG: GSU2403 family nucleotidyltransferase fold protein [Candidatus Omnitrophota bacterium]|nr:GSU2403 family nucleotidyltransferase fold protein [Candidatus Omnitrophota bacterium]